MQCGEENKEGWSTSSYLIESMVQVGSQQHRFKSMGSLIG